MMPCHSFFCLSFHFDVATDSMFGGHVISYTVVLIVSSSNFMKIFLLFLPMANVYNVAYNNNIE